MTTWEKRILPCAFWALSGLETLDSIFMMLQIPADPKNAVLAGFSMNRIVMIAGGAGLGLLFLILAWTAWKMVYNNRWGTDGGI